MMIHHRQQKAGMRTGSQVSTIYLALYLLNGEMEFVSEPVEVVDDDDTSQTTESRDEDWQSGNMKHCP